MILSLFTSGTYTYTNKVIQWQTEKKGAAAPNHRKGQGHPQHQDAAGQRHIHLNWSNFKPEFSGILEEDPEAHLH